MLGQIMITAGINFAAAIYIGGAINRMFGTSIDTTNTWTMVITMIVIMIPQMLINIFGSHHLMELPGLLRQGLPVNHYMVLLLLHMTINFIWLGKERTMMNVYGIQFLMELPGYLNNQLLEFLLLSDLNYVLYN